MHELGVKRFFDVHGKMAIRLENVDGHEWPKRAAITINELRDAIVSSVRKQTDEIIKIKIDKENDLWLEELMEQLMNKIVRQTEKNGFDVFGKEEKKLLKIDINIKTCSLDRLTELVNILSKEVQYRKYQKK
ncbi:hypothetical protein LCGC14_1509950 [marine sediment metagenome]|uniref:Uncharacterized protein n=1 Tax=marine sediment metagenome TaxID=412755 RepID=A0A0F9J1X7_9ZZZZ